MKKRAQELSLPLIQMGHFLAQPADIRTGASLVCHYIICIPSFRAKIKGAQKNLSDPSYALYLEILLIRSPVLKARSKSCSLVFATV
jgi:hypothetical protein